MASEFTLTGKQASGRSFRSGECIFKGIYIGEESWNDVIAVVRK